MRLVFLSSEGKPLGFQWRRINMGRPENVYNFWRKWANKQVISVLIFISKHETKRSLWRRRDLKRIWFYIKQTIIKPIHNFSLFLFHFSLARLCLSFALLLTWCGLCAAKEAKIWKKVEKSEKILLKVLTNGWGLV